MQDSELETGAGPRSGQAGEAGLDNEMLVSCRVLTTDGAVAAASPARVLTLANCAAEHGD